MMVAAASAAMQPDRVRDEHVGEEHKLQADGGTASDAASKINAR